MGVKQQIKDAVELVERGLDKNIRICVTGLSGSGKTAFVTSIIHQLLHHKNSEQLPFWLAHAEGRILAVQKVTHSELHIPEFPYEKALQALEQGDWPESTSNISQVRLSIKYQIKNKWVKKLQTTSHLNVDIIDYPGEWLLDLPLLSHSFESWSRQFYSWLEQNPQSLLATEWLSALANLDGNVPNDGEIKNSAAIFRDFLQNCKNSPDGIHFIQPGRFVLAGDLEGAPVLDFFPLPEANLDQNNNLKELLEKRFNYYRDKIVQPFFKEYFSKVDRQLLLVDVLKTLNQGFGSYKDLQQTLSKLITSFNYGESNWLKRMFQPKISKLIIASSKSDHVPPEQHGAMKSFLENMLRNAENQVGYQGVNVNSLVFSSIQTTEPVLAEHNNSKLACIKGLELDSKKEIVNYPGKIPSAPMSKQKWKEQEYNFVDFAIPELATDSQLPHHRMDRLVELLIGDKFL